MPIWEIIIIAGLVFLLVEIFTPTMFFLNFAIASFITSVFALFFTDWNILVPVFVVLSAIFLVFLRPFLLKKKNGYHNTGVEDKYIGKCAKVIEKVDGHKGVISIYDERWNAISENGEEIQIGEEVEILKNESLLFFVKKKN